MKSRREQILIASRNLFNLFGYSNVTIRMIALELQISSGNLNYHFKKREDILEALYFEMVAPFDERVKEMDVKKISLQSIKEDVVSSMERMLAYQFFWTDMFNLLKLNEQIRQHFESVYQTRFQGYRLLFKALLANNHLQAFQHEMEEDLLIERMINFGNTWLYNSFLYRKKVDSKYIDLQANQWLLMLYPYLTESAQKDFEQLFPSCFA